MIAEPEAVEAIAAALRNHVQTQSDAIDGFAEALYSDLHSMAHRELRRLRPGQTLDTTGLVNECYLKLAQGKGQIADRNHFLAASAIAMRHVLVNTMRAKLAAKRGGGNNPQTLDEESLRTEQAHAEHVIAVNDALARLRQVDPRLGSVVECRFFAGMTEEETGLALGVSYRTVRRDWQRARAWLRHDLGRATDPRETTAPIGPGSSLT